MSPTTKCPECKIVLPKGLPVSSFPQTNSGHFQRPAYRWVSGGAGIFVFCRKHEQEFAANLAFWHGIVWRDSVFRVGNRAEFDKLAEDITGWSM